MSDLRIPNPEELTKVDDEMRQHTGLKADLRIRYSPGEYPTFAGAMKMYQARERALSGHGEDDLGIFSREYSASGARMFSVQTFAGFCADRVRIKGQNHV